MAKSIIGIFTLIFTTCFYNLCEAKDWSFDVWLDGQKIGKHTFSLNQNVLQSNAEFNVKILFISAYRYRHSAQETWQGECLSRLEANTEENSEKIAVKGQLLGSQFVVEKSKDKQTLPACVMTFAYWNPEILKQTKLLNPQNAEYLDITVLDDGVKKMKVKGALTTTHQYRLLGRYQDKEKLKITLWYDENQSWVGLESTTPEGYIITYKLV